MHQLKQSTGSVRYLAGPYTGHKTDILFPRFGKVGASDGNCVVSKTRGFTSEEICPGKVRSKSSLVVRSY